MSSIHERFEINVSADQVYEALSRPERIVGALPGVSSIYRFDNDRYRVDIGAAGRSDELDLEVTERVPPRHIAWRSRDGRWSGGIDIESLGANRALVIVQVHDSQAGAAQAEGSDDAAVIDAALRALKQALEAAATEPAGRGAGDADTIRVEQRSAEDRQRDERSEGREGHREDPWRGSRSFLRGGGDQAVAMMRSLSREMDKLWEQVMRRAAGASRGASGFMGGWAPPIEMCEQDDDLRLCVEVPGIAPADLHVEIDQGLVIIRGERRPESAQGSFARSERSYGSFVRRIPLPEGLHVDQARAQLKHGVLEIRIPLPRVRRGREIPIENADAERPA